MREIKACLFVDENGGTPSEGSITAHQAYTMIVSWLRMYVFDGGQIEYDIRPFQLPYRDFDLYLVDIGGYPQHMQSAFMRGLGNLVVGRSSRLFLFWTGETWEAFQEANPGMEDYETCINCCDPNALLKIDEILLDMPV